MKNTKMKLELAMLNAAGATRNRMQKLFLRKRRGIDGIVVTVGLCVIALALCLIMSTELGDFIKDIVGKLGTKADNLLGGTGI